MKDKVRIIFEGMTYKSSYRILEAGKDDAELEKIGNKIGMDLPSPDIAIFKGLYAITDEENRNNCTLPKEEVEKALSSLRGKAVDIDHIRKNTVGVWLDASLEGEEIICYGSFWKSNYEKEYEDFKSRMDEGGVAISFEAWGDREMKEDGSYNLKDIHFAGGALLDEEDPACPGAGVLEFAKVMDTGKTGKDLEESKNKKKIKEQASLYAYEIEQMWWKISEEVKHPDAGDDDYTWWKLLKVDLVDNLFTIEDMDTGDVFVVDTTYQLTKATKDNAKSLDNITKKIGGRNSMTEEQIKELMEEVASLKVKVEGKDAELAGKDSEIVSMTEKLDEATKNMEEAKESLELKAKEIEEAQTKLTEIEEAKAKEVEEANAKLIEERKEELGEFAKELTDEQILDEKEYKIAKLEKANSELATANKDGKVLDMSAGSTKDGDQLSVTMQKQKKIQASAWND